MSDELLRELRIWIVTRYNLHTFVEMKGVSYRQAKSYLGQLGIGWNNATGELFLRRK